MVNTFAPFGAFVCVRRFSVCIFCFRRYKTISANNNKDLLVNEEIKAAEVRVLGPQNEQVGIMKLDDALTYAANNGVDLVLIVPNATPPVCRAIDYGKFCFERDKREKEAKKKHQSHILEKAALLHPHYQQNNVNF